MDAREPDIEFTPVRPRRGGQVHAATLSNPTKTACGRTFSGWMIALEKLSCRACALAVIHDCREKEPER